MEALTAHSGSAVIRRSGPLSALTKHNCFEHRTQVQTPQVRSPGSSVAVQATLATPPTAAPGKVYLPSTSSTRRTSWDQPTLSPSQWISALAPEIVSRVEQAPFFHLAFDHERKTELRKVDEADVGNPDSWPQLCRRMMTSNPDAVVFVHELDVVEDDRSSPSSPEDLIGTSSFAESRPNSRNSLCPDFNSTKTWGLVLLGRGYKHSCYILRTSKVLSPAGATTHFSLTKAKCFAPSLHEQMEQAWLVRS